MIRMFSAPSLIIFFIFVEKLSVDLFGVDLFMLFLSYSLHGQSIVEYAIILVLVAISIIVLLALFGEEIQSLYNSVNNAF